MMQTHDPTQTKYTILRAKLTNFPAVPSVTGDTLLAVAVGSTTKVTVVTLIGGIRD